MKRLDNLSGKSIWRMERKGNADRSKGRTERRKKISGRGEGRLGGAEKIGHPLVPKHQRGGEASSFRRKPRALLSPCSDPGSRNGTLFVEQTSTASRGPSVFPERISSTSLGPPGCFVRSRWTRAPGDIERIRLDELEKTDRQDGSQGAGKSRQQEIENLRENF